MYTGQEIFEIAIDIIDELNDSGGITDSQVKEYKNRATRLLDIWQKEIANNGDLYATEEYEYTDEDNLNKWVKYSAPANMKRIKDIIFEDDDSQIGTIDYKEFGKTEIYFYFTNTGTVRMLYVPIPTKITLLTQTLEVDDMTATSGAYYLAEHFAMADQNDELAKKCRNKFAELKNESLSSVPLSATEIRDVY